ncbi:class I SAM-dependent methyltransferase, partial [Patescibacteria group bacterium]|nr:class I SAM-dependent methyltransferase [Patescibacteria group bacterium]
SDPFLAVLPSKAKYTNGVIVGRKKQKFSFTAYPFNDREFEVMRETIPKFEFLFGETKLFVTLCGAPISAEVWEAGMELSDLAAYSWNIHPMIIQEISNLVLEPGSLICEPACNTGELVAKIHQQFPGFSVVGSDLSLILVDQAKEKNPGLQIYQADARGLNYLRTSSVDLFVLSGLVNEAVLTREQGEQVLEEVAFKSQDYSYLIITGKSFPLFDELQLGQMGFYPLLRTKWCANSYFSPFNIYLTPRKIVVDADTLEAVPIWRELDDELRTEE